MHLRLPHHAHPQLDPCIKPRLGAWLERAFRVGIYIKGFDSICEIVGGCLLLALNARQAARLVWILTRHELSDFARVFGAVYLIVNGIVKLGLIAGMLRRMLWTYPAAIGVLSALVIYGAYRLVLTHSPLLAVIMAVDIVVIALIWAEYQRLRRAWCAR